MIRLAVESETQLETVLRVDGWVAGQNVALLEEEGAPHLKKGGRLVLDLRGVRFIDRDGIQLLRSWARGRLVVRGSSPFVGAMLAHHGLSTSGS